MKTTHVLLLLIEPVSLRSAWDISRAWSPTCESLRVRDHRERERGLARGLGAIDLDDATARQAADTQRNVEPDRATGNHVHRAPSAILPQLHDGALAELLLDLLEGKLECLDL